MEGKYLRDFGPAEMGRGSQLYQLYRQVEVVLEDRVETGH